MQRNSGCAPQQPKLLCHALQTCIQQKHVTADEGRSCAERAPSHLLVQSVTSTRLQGIRPVRNAAVQEEIAMKLSQAPMIWMKDAS